MKAVCAKPGKGGKIHPSPLGGGDADPAAVALRLLPAAILALTAALRPEDQQVLAYLVTRSLQGAAAPQPEQPAVRGRRRRSHPPAIGCGCFDCYTSFWSRWDCSPDRELIHEAIDAFEDHLAAAESSAATPSPSSKRREKGKRKAPHSPPPPPPMSPKTPEPLALEKVREPSPPPASPPPPHSPEACAVESDSEENVPEDSTAAEAAAAEGPGGEEERKRGWADVMGMLNLRLWGIWSPAVESAT